MAEPIPVPTHNLAGAFNFAVALLKSGGPSGAGDRLGDGGFQECSGLEIEMDVQEHQEGGRNDGVVRLVGRGKYGNLVLKRGMFHTADGPVNPEIWRWLQGILAGERPVTRYDGIVQVLDRHGLRDESYRVLATWTFSRGLPVKVRGPELNAKTGEIAIEELHIAHEGLRLSEEGAP